MPPSLHSIAKRVGCAKTTVSLALRNKGHLSEQLRQKVLTTAADMGYVPSGPGRKRQTPATPADEKKILPQLAPLLMYRFEETNIADSPYFGPRVAGMRQVLDKCGITLQLLLPSTPVALRSLLDVVQSGAMIMGRFKHFEPDLQDALRLLARHSPVVLVGNRFPGARQEISTVHGDYGCLGAILAQHCIDSDRRSVVAVFRRRDELLFDLHAALAHALESAGARYSLQLYEEGRPPKGKFWQELISRHGQEASAVIGDATSVQRLEEEAKTAGLEVPGDVAFATIGNRRGLRLATRVKPARCFFDEAQMGAVAAQTWLDLYKDLSAPRKVLLPPHVEAGDSFPELF